jgi:beta-glucosidase
MDLEMPGPVRRRGKHILEALKLGHLTEEHITTCARRVLQLLHRTGKYKIPNWQESREKAVDLPEHRAILRKAGAEGTSPFNPDML